MDVEVTRERLFKRLNAFYDDFTKWHELYDDTRYRCLRSGNCCQVGLELHYMECENIARNLELRFKESPGMRERVIASLEQAFTDPDWEPDDITGALHCAFFDAGCSIYAFRPAVCRMYGVVLDVDDYCPRERLASGEPLLFTNEDIDRLIARFYRALDEYGKLQPDRDYTVFMPRGVLEFLLDPKEFEALRKRTPKRFWQRADGYRTQFRKSARMPEDQQRASRIIVRLK